MNIPEIYLIEPYNAYAPKGKKKHWHQIVEEQALLARIIAEQQALIEAKSKTTPPDAPPDSVQTVGDGGIGSGASGGAGGAPVWTFFNPGADTVGFTWSPTTGAGPLTVQFVNTTTTPEQDSYNWYFGDGQTSTAVNPSHVYQSGSNAAFRYTISLQTTNSITGAPGTSSIQYLSCSIPVVTSKFIYVTQSGIAPNTASFTNQSGNTSQTPSTNYLWIFGDGKTSATSDTLVVHPYLSNSLMVGNMGTGSFTASLQTSGSYGLYALYTQSFYLPGPTITPAFTVVTSSNGTAPLSMSVINTSTTTTGSIDSVIWRWDFGNGLSSSNASPSGIVYETGSFNVVLQITESTYQLKSRVVLAGGVTASAPVMTPLFTVVTSSNGTAPLSMSTINASTTTTASIGDSINYLWVFGDGTTSTSASPTHAYYTGSFNVTLQVTESRYSIVTSSVLAGGVTASAPQVTASFTVAPGDGTDPTLETFTNATTVVTSSQGDILVYLWEFGSASLANATTRTPSAQRYSGSGVRVTASLQVTESWYGIATRSTRSFYIT